MKRTPLKRKSTLTRKPLARGVKRLRRTGLKRQGKRMQREKEALEAFRVMVRADAQGLCSMCGNPGVHAHHLVPRSIAAGHENTHHHLNGALLCIQCHDEVHTHSGPDRHPFRRSRDYLDTIATNPKT